MGPMPGAEPPAAREDMYEHVADSLAKTDRLQHENDILFVTNFAMEKHGVRGLREFAEWMHRQLAHAKTSGMHEEDDPKWGPKPEIEVLAKYLRAIEYYGRQ